MMRAIDRYPRLIDVWDITVSGDQVSACIGQVDAAVEDFPSGTVSPFFLSEFKSRVFPHYGMRHINKPALDEEGNIVVDTLSEWVSSAKDRLYTAAQKVLPLATSYADVAFKSLTDNGRSEVRKGYSAPDGSLDTAYVNGAESYDVTGEWAEGAKRCAEVQALPSVLELWYKELDRLFLGVI